MKLYKVYGTGKLKSYTASVYIVLESGAIWTENKELGFFKHPEIKTQAELEERITELVNQGFSVDVCRAFEQ